MPKNKKHKNKKDNGSAVDKAAGQVPESREEGRNILMPEAELLPARFMCHYVRSLYTIFLIPSQILLATRGLFIV